MNNLVNNSIITVSHHVLRGVDFAGGVMLGVFVIIVNKSTFRIILHIAVGNF